MTKFHVKDVKNPIIEMPMIRIIDMFCMFEKMLLLKRAIAAAKMEFVVKKFSIFFWRIVSWCFQNSALMLYSFNSCGSLALIEIKSLPSPDLTTKPTGILLSVYFKKFWLSIQRL
jgi:hypothetical protein